MRVDNDPKAVDEPILGVEMEREAYVPLLVEQFVCVLDQSPGLVEERPYPTLGHVDLAALGDAAARKVALDADVRLEVIADVANSRSGQVGSRRRDPLSEACGVRPEIERHLLADVTAGRRASTGSPRGGRASTDSSVGS